MEQRCKYIIYKKDIDFRLCEVLQWLLRKLGEWEIN